MSYLDALRFHFFGDFFSDPSTINNHEGPLHRQHLEVVDYTLPNADGLAQMPGRYVRFGEHDAHDELVVLDAAT